MSMTILRRREPEPFEVPPLPARLSGQDLRDGLARFCPSVTIRLRPGERIIGGRIYYSSAWLGAHDLPHVKEFWQRVDATFDQLDKEDTVGTTYEVRTRFNLEPERG